ncbi:MAG TPA: site-2 protease family protein [archaeon]|nr:site-2 protease family protein [archaeon]
MTTTLWIILVFAFAAFCATFARLVFKQRTTLWILILLDTKSLIKRVNKLAEKHKKALTAMSVFGVAVGFGPFGVDYLIKDKATKKKRIFIFIISLLIATYISYLLAGSMFFGNPLIPKFISYLIIILTGIMGLSGFILGALLFSAYDIIAKMFVGKVACPGIGLVIPGVKVPKTNFFIPWYGWLILIPAAFIHEFSHGIMLRVAKIKLKSIGVMLLGILPLGAYVEPDEEKFKKIDNKKKLKMYAAGPTSNLIVAIIFFIVYLLISAPIANYTTSIDNQREIGLVVSQVTATTEVCGSSFDNPAFGKLVKNDLIISVNGNLIKSRNDLTKNIKKDQENEFVVKNLDTNITRTEYITTNELGNIGITADVLVDETIKVPKDYSFYKILLSVILWVALLNFILATTNFLPTIPFDGGFMAQIIFCDFLNKKKNNEEKRMKKVMWFFICVLIFLALLNIIPYFL